MTKREATKENSRGRKHSPAAPVYTQHTQLCFSIKHQTSKQAPIKVEQSESPIVLFSLSTILYYILFQMLWTDVPFNHNNVVDD